MERISIPLVASHPPINSKSHTTIKRTQYPSFGGIGNILSLPPVSLTFPAPSPLSASTPAILVSGQKQCVHCHTVSGYQQFSAPCRTVQCSVPYSAVCRAVPCLNPCRQQFCNPCSIRALPPKCCCYTPLDFQQRIVGKSSPLSATSPWLAHYNVLQI